jgi:hypothetical protein
MPKTETEVERLMTLNTGKDGMQVRWFENVAVCWHVPVYYANFGS